MGILAVSFYGPFAYFIKTDRIDVMAPKCPGHRASIASALDQYPLRGRSCHGKDYSYRLKSPAIIPGKVDIANTPPILDTDAPLSHNADPFFVLSVPLPSLIHGIHPDKVEVVKSGPPRSVLAATATALRFFYLFDMTKSQELQLLRPLSTSSSPLRFISPQLPGLGKIDHADVTVRYESSQGEDIDKTDAQECFLKLRDMLGLDWWLSYDSGSSHQHIEVRSGVDCRAPVLISR